MIECVIFDLGGVIISSGIEDYACTTASNYFQVSKEELKTAMRKNKKGLQLPGWDERRYWQKVATDLGVSDASNTPRFWTEKYEETTPPNKEVVELAKQLRLNGYRLAVLSNTVQEHVDVNRKRKVFELFDVEVFSCDPKVNSHKPEKKIYDYCLEKIGLPPEKCVFIDNMEENLVPAREMGIKAILFESAEQAKRDLEKLGVKI